MITTPHNPLILFTFPLFFYTIFALNSDGTTLLSLKHSQPSSIILQNWNKSDTTPCSWFGVTCAPKTGSVIGLSLPNANLIGSIPIVFGHLQYLRFLDLSNNSINGTIPISIFRCLDLETVNLSYNLMSGEVPEEISELQSLQELNISHNYFSGGVTRDFPENLVADFSFNNFTGEIPASLSSLEAEYFAGNKGLCGKPLNKMCIVPSFHSNPPNVTSEGSVSPTNAALAAIPKTGAAGKAKNGGRDVKIGKIVAIVVGDVATVVIFAALLFYAYKLRKKNSKNTKEIEKNSENPKETESTCLCFNVCAGNETFETTTETESVAKSEEKEKCLVMVDGETELEMETLYKASAYILGSSGESIVYKTVVGGGAAFAVRRIGESRVEKMGEFEKIVRVLGKFRHDNLVKVRGFVWSEDEKLVIYDYVPNGSLATSAVYKKVGASSCQLSFEVRLKIAKGIGKGLAYIHEKKHVHGNIKPSNILLTLEMDPMISDFGLEWLISGKPNSTIITSARNSSSKRSISSHEETAINGAHRHLANYNTLPYQAPESVKSEKPNPKWDVYSFGIILLELLLGKVLSNKDLGQWNIGSSIAHNEAKILKIVDGFVTTDLNKKDSILTCIKLGFNCASMTPQKRPSMKEALQVLEKIPCQS